MIEEKHREVIVNCGAFNYPLAKISSITEIDISILREWKADSNSEFNRLIQKGVDMSDYYIDLKLFEMAKNGDVKALQTYNQRKDRRYDNDTQ
jgi:hypothetical protein